MFLLSLHSFRLDCFAVPGWWTTPGLCPQTFSLLLFSPSVLQLSMPWTVYHQPQIWLTKHLERDKLLTASYDKVCFTALTAFCTFSVTLIPLLITHIMLPFFFLIPWTHAPSCHKDFVLDGCYNGEALLSIFTWLHLFKHSHLQPFMNTLPKVLPTNSFHMTVLIFLHSCYHYLIIFPILSWWTVFPSLEC